MIRDFLTKCYAVFARLNHFGEHHKRWQFKYRRQNLQHQLEGRPFPVTAKTGSQLQGSTPVPLTTTARQLAVVGYQFIERLRCEPTHTVCREN